MYKVLLVEDDRITSTLIQRYIKDLDYELIAAVSTGEEAVDIINRDMPHVVLMDINLEGNLDGIESANRIENRDMIPFVYITSSSDQSTINRAKESNAYGYIIKPFDKKDLRATIEMALVRHSMERQIKSNEVRVSTVLNNIVDAVLVIEENGGIGYVNDAAERLFKEPKSELLNKNVGEVVKIGSDPRGDSSIAIPMGMDYSEFSNFLTTKTAKIPIDFTSTPIRESNGRVNGAVLVIKDITQQVEFEKKIKENLDALSRILYGTIEAMSTVVETRDPYTAGHQQNVSNIAVAIAEEMALSRDMVEGIRLAGQIHDLGKIAIPAEILSKPGRISNDEFNLIKSHPRMGSDIIKNIDFPWPIAEIVLQHHEKMDGSGYPNGLCGDEILLESRILSVADVVEAMASHRPYRASLGLDVALEEIKKYRGSSFDADVADACFRVFKYDYWKSKF